jgi:hypothetical protein
MLTFTRRIAAASAARTEFPSYGGAPNPGGKDVD